MAVVTELKVIEKHALFKVLQWWVALPFMQPRLANTVPKALRKLDKK